MAIQAGIGQFLERTAADERVRKLQALSAALVAAASEEQVAEALLDQAMTAMGADAGVVAMREPSGGRFLVLCVRDVRMPQPGAEAAVLPEAVVAAVARRELLLVESGDPRWMRTAAETQGFTLAGCDAGAVVPVALGERVLGALLLGFTRRRFAAEDRRVLEALAQQAAQALERTRVVSSLELLVRQRTAELEQAN